MLSPPYAGPWAVVAGDSLQRRPRLQRGQLMRHSSGHVILNCPACDATQFVVAQVTGPDAAPSLSRDVTCGAGYCKRCGITFTVVGGRTVVRDAPLRQKK